MSTLNLDGDRDGLTFEHDEDYDRLNRQGRLVWRVMADGHWHTLESISTATDMPQASVSARLRDFRKERFGGHTVERQRHAFARGTYEYRLIVRAEQN